MDAQPAVERLQCLLALSQAAAPVVVIASFSSLLERVVPPELIRRNVYCVKEGDPQDRDGLVALLVRLGYTPAPVVERPGDYAVRGGLIDVYPLTEPQPLRIDFFGDSIETIRTFDPETQRSIQRVPEARIGQAVMVPAEGEGEGRRSAREKIKERAHQLELPRQRILRLLEKVEGGLPLQEQIPLLPYLCPDLVTVFEHLPPDRVVVAADPTVFGDALDSCSRELEESVRDAAAKGLVIAPAAELFVDPEEIRQAVGRTLSVVFHEFSGMSLGAAASSPGEGASGGEADRASGKVGQAEGECWPSSPFLEDLAVSAPRAADSLRGGPGLQPRGLSSEVEAVRRWVGQGLAVFVVCSTGPECDRMGKLLAEYGLPYHEPRGPVRLEEQIPSGGLFLLQGRIGEGFIFPLLRSALLTEEDLFGPKIHRPRERERPRSWRPPDLSDMRPGDYVVHTDFGIGVYRGLETLDIRGYVNDYLHLEYAGGDKLYLPVDRTSRIQRYVGTDETPPPLDKLGGTSWARTKQRVKASILEMAEELVSLYAARMVKKGFSFSKPDASYEEFEGLFPFEETPDQKRAIQDVLADMESERPMDRLVCGDVGFGKTEVAIRAAFKAVMDGKQAAVLVPTTVLAQQHFANFKKRFEGYPVAIEMLSRFRSRAEQKKVLEGLAKGRVDIVIGTHRLLQKDVVFRDLGLLIVDEEQRFGVKQKELLKTFRTQVDVLTLTATPIPRTLQMSLLGIRDLSLINTPPQGRRSIETYLVPFDPDILRAAVLREIARGGQVFFLHNQVYNIDSIAAKLREIVPEARIAVAHGQMPEKQLERIMLDFIDKKHDVLVCTTIIESGLDIPNANTIIIHRADRFGLAQLYQIRGRVGRSRQQAFAYLIVPDEDALYGEARKRVEVLEEFRELGSGFRVARYDLEIRGAGNLLGPSQSGHIKAVGYDLYMEMMEKAVRRLKGEEVIEDVDPEIHLDVPAYVPDSYIEDPTQRLTFYKRLASAADTRELEDLRAEMVDRYGPIPDLVKTLFEVMEFKVALRALRVREARFSEDGLTLVLDEHSPIDVDRLLSWIARAPERLRVYPDHRLWVAYPAGAPGESVLRKGISILAALKGEGDGEPRLEAASTSAAGSWEE